MFVKEARAARLLFTKLRDAGLFKTQRNAPRILECVYTVAK